MEQDQLNILEFLRILRKRKKIFFIVCIPIVIAAIVVSLLMTKIYQSDAVISYTDKDKRTGIGSLTAELPEMLSPLGITTSSNVGEIIKLLQSKSMAAEVVEAEAVGQDNEDVHRGKLLCDGLPDACLSNAG